jgi:hypothetical protein
MDLRIAGAAWPDEHDDLLHMAQVLAVGIRIQGLPRAQPR